MKLKPNGHCEFSLCRKYRYTLWRNWSDEADLGLPDDANKQAYGSRSDYLQVIGLNPSTADEKINDPTVKRCINFAKRWGFGALCMTNLFAWRDTDPAGMKKQRGHAVGHLNDRWLEDTAKGAGMILFAWGNHGKFLDQAELVSQVLHMKFPNKTVALRLTKAGLPGHPLYIPAATVPFGFPR